MRRSMVSLKWVPTLERLHRSPRRGDHRVHVVRVVAGHPSGNFTSHRIGLVTRDETSATANGEHGLPQTLRVVGRGQWYGH